MATGSSSVKLGTWAPSIVHFFLLSCGFETFHNKEFLKYQVMMYKTDAIGRGKSMRPGKRAGMHAGRVGTIVAGGELAEKLKVEGREERLH